MSGYIDGGGGNPNYTIRGAERDYHNRDTGNPHRLIIVFPLEEVGKVPRGANGITSTQGGPVQEATFEMFINPRQLTFRHPTRSQIIQTLGGAYVDSFGYGLPTGAIQGTFGWGKDGANRTGLDRATTLKALYYGWQQLTTRTTALCHLMLPGNENTDTHINMLIFPGDLEFTRSQNSPLTVDFSLSFTVMKDFNGPIRPQVLPPIGTVPAEGGTPPVKSPYEDAPDVPGSRDY